MRLILCLLFLLITTGCANMVPPTGGKKDVTPPKLLEVSPDDSLLNTRVTEIEMQFDEFVTLTDVSKEIKMSPLLPFPLNAVVTGKKVKVKIPDSLLKDNTTYKLNFGTAIKDLHESNPFVGYEYVFSTGTFFDSMQLNGFVIEAATGKPASDVQILLYDAEKSDSAIVREKPEYVFTANGGSFVITGLPNKPFKVYALLDKNDNLVYDGEEEMIGFVDSIFKPHDSLVAPIKFNIFKEIPVIDTSLVEKEKKKDKPEFRGKKKKGQDAKKEFKYNLNVDTSNTEKGTFDVNNPIKVTFNQSVDTYDVGRLRVNYDSVGVDVSVDVRVKRDTLDNVLFLDADWQTDKVYTVKMMKDFADDTSGLYSMPSKHIFRTMSDEDYGVIHVNIPQKYYGSKHLLMVTREKDTVYKKTITDTTITLKRLKPATYALWIIFDENENGKWDTGDLFAKKQPEEVLPHNTNIELKAGWENVIDFTMPLSEGGDKWGNKDKKGRTDKK